MASANGVLHAGHPVTFDSIPGDSTIKVFTLSGHWVRTLRPDSTGSATWNLTNDGGDAVASGLYLYLINSPTGQTAGKIAIIR